jgi:hypothetical protein
VRQHRKSKETHADKLGLCLSLSLVEKRRSEELQNKLTQHEHQSQKIINTSVLTIGWRLDKR